MKVKKIIIITIIIANINLIYTSNLFNKMEDECKCIGDIKNSNENNSYEKNFFLPHTDHKGNLFENTESQEQYNNKYIENLKNTINSFDANDQKKFKSYFFHTPSSSNFSEKSFSIKRLIDHFDTNSREYQDLLTAFSKRDEKENLFSKQNQNMHCFASYSNTYFEYKNNANSKINRISKI